MFASNHVNHCATVWKQYIAYLVGFLFLTVSFSCLSATPPYKIGLALWTGYPDSLEGFKAGLAENGIDLSRDVIFLPSEISSNRDVQIDVAKGFAQEKVDLVYSLTTPGTVIVKENLPITTPIVFSIVTYPADSGLIESFSYSGNNLVGTSNYIPLKHYVSLIF